MIPFIELIDSYHTTLAIIEPEEKRIDSGKNSMKYPSQGNSSSGADGKWIPLSRTINGTLFP
jgi:hypothetical protein